MADSSDPILSLYSLRNTLKLNQLVMQNSLRLVAWTISNRTYLQKGYQKGLPTSSQTIGEHLRWGLGKTNFLLAILININRYLHQQPLVGWDKFLQWQVSTKKSLRRTHLNQHHLQSNWGLFSKVIGHLSRSRSLVTGFNISKILQKTYLGT